MKFDVKTPYCIIRPLLERCDCKTFYDLAIGSYGPLVYAAKFYNEGGTLQESFLKGKDFTLEEVTNRLMEGCRVIYCDYRTGAYYRSFLRITNDEVHIYLDV